MIDKPIEKTLADLNVQIIAEILKKNSELTSLLTDALDTVASSAEGFIRISTELKTVLEKEASSSNKTAEVLTKINDATNKLAMTLDNAITGGKRDTEVVVKRIIDKNVELGSLLMKGVEAIANTTGNLADTAQGFVDIGKQIDNVPHMLKGRTKYFVFGIVLVFINLALNALILVKLV